MEPDIRFFQAAATAIPTLLIAVAISGRVLEEKLAPLEGQAGVRLWLSTVLLITIAGGELTALRVLAAGHGSQRQYETVLASIMVAILLIGLQVALRIHPEVVADFKPRRRRLMYGFCAALVLMAFFIYR